MGNWSFLSLNMAWIFLNFYPSVSVVESVFGWNCVEVLYCHSIMVGPDYYSSGESWWYVLRWSVVGCTVWGQRISNNEVNEISPDPLMCLDLIQYVCTFRLEKAFAIFQNLLWKTWLILLYFYGKLTLYMFSLEISNNPGPVS